MMSASGSQSIILIAISSMLCCKTLGLPAMAYSSIRSGPLSDVEGDWTNNPEIPDLASYKLLYEVANAMDRPSRHADGLFTSGYSKLLGQLSAKEYLDSLIAKRVSDDMSEEQVPVKRHSDAVFTDNYSRLRKQMAVKKYLNSVLSGRSLAEPMPEDSKRSASSLQSYDQVDKLLKQIPLTL